MYQQWRIQMMRGNKLCKKKTKNKDVKKIKILEKLMAITFKKTTLIVLMKESNKLREAIKIQVRENLTEKVVLEDRHKVVAIEREEVLEKVMLLKVWKEKKRKLPKNNKNKKQKLITKMNLKNQKKKSLK